MDAALALITANFWSDILPWLGLAALAMQWIFRIVDRDHFGGRSMIERHARLSMEKTGYVAAFMARNGISVTLALFVISGLSNTVIEGQFRILRDMAIGFASIHLIFHATVVFLVSGAILRGYQSDSSD
ncbi:MAG: hypothetical protein AAF697_03865 [Pseudomonadota bacterium]